MLKISLKTCVAVAVFGLGSLANGDVLAQPPFPEDACAAENEGAYAMTTEYSSEYVEHATYVCSDNAWALLVISRCYYNNGRCAPP
jgi:hypothetical protein